MEGDLHRDALGQECLRRVGDAGDARLDVIHASEVVERTEVDEHDLEHSISGDAVVGGVGIDLRLGIELQVVTLVVVTAHLLRHDLGESLEELKLVVVGGEEAAIQTDMDIGHFCPPFQVRMTASRQPLTGDLPIIACLCLKVNIYNKKRPRSLPGLYLVELEGIAPSSMKN